MTSYCLKCRDLVLSWIRYSEGKVYLAKHCVKCGHTETEIESDWEYTLSQDNLPRTSSQNDCYMIDITQKCDAGCRSCYSRGTAHRSIVDFMEELESIPKASRVLISGGEPLQRPNFELFFTATANMGHFPILLTNGAYLTMPVYEKLLSGGLCCYGSPQIAVSLGLPGTNTTFKRSFANLQQIKVADIAFTIDSVSEIPLVIDLSTKLRGHYDSICIRTAWDGSNSGLFVSDIIKTLNGELVLGPTPHGYRSAMVHKDGILYKILSWPSWKQWDKERYEGRGVWYKGDNVVNTLVKTHVATLSLS